MDRFAENTPPASAHDFRRRKRYGSLYTIGLLYIAGMLAMCYGLFTSHNPNIAVITAILFGLLGVYSLFVLLRNLDLVTEAEFQNALLSSALTSPASFTLLVREDGSFAFSDHGFKEMFPGISRRNNRGLDEMAEAAAMATSETERLHDALRNGKREYFLFTLTDKDGSEHPIRLSVQPLARPQGFFLIQGREYVPNRAGAQQSVAPATTVSNINIYVDHMLNALPFGVYIASPSGRLRVMSRTLEILLGYERNEAIDLELSIRDLFYRAGQNAPDEGFGTKDIEGDWMLARKNGALAHVFLEQFVIRDETGAATAVMGLIEPEEGYKS